MAELALARIGSRGEMTLPDEVRAALGVQPGDYLAMVPVGGGLLIWKSTSGGETEAEQRLRDLAVEIGRAAEERGIREDADLDRIVEEIQEQVYRANYGG